MENEFMDHEKSSKKPLQNTPPIIYTWLTIFDQISPAPVLILEQERLYESLGARGKPSTFVYRAGWLVEPFSFANASAVWINIHFVMHTRKTTNM